ncbi:hypothetical protein M670_05008 [Schinkia azotoformans MEV2011]|uniref:Uncharacterized protein n=1 Tax=Schinkia azotoformans MEV2011 TaxID=1348973 RepID=A0A072NF18_SCHAZ|nr:hypothetical protein [Schinkia azotoformans]KEF35832.1 hypothetical protein M670_05008 [Schinkia azotoformans MEV2011]MEC1696241.1 hypothetical protein [Schinkia azotoformans]MEC1727309.1 hypothetical protein [Schinkia azotoformans]MEC1772371.1 hypothetical protein [Schinkia azotoformans]MEC1782092.1 hypothetical protein [Schinkia azotoformans]
MELIRVIPYEIWGILIFIYGSYRLYILINYTEKHEYLVEISAIFLSYSGALITFLAHFKFISEFPVSLFITLILISIIMGGIGRINSYKKGSFENRMEIKSRLVEALIMLIMLAVFLIIIFFIKHFIM